MRRTTKRLVVTAGAIGISIAGMALEAGASPNRDGGALSGQVVDAVTHEVLDSVQVRVKGSNLRANSASDGSFFLDEILGDKVSLLISRRGYQSREVSVVVTKAPVKWTVALWPAR